LLAADACFVRRHHYASDGNIDNSISLLTPLTLHLSRLPPGKCRAHAVLDCGAVRLDRHAQLLGVGVSDDDDERPQDSGLRYFADLSVRGVCSRVFRVCMAFS
jgi:hypothetical protein